MRRTPFDPPNGLTEAQRTWWDKWVDRAARRKAEVKPGATLDTAVWRDLKDWLFENVFHKKCAYCEARVKSVYPGDGEHYRPKGNVTVKDAQGKKVQIKDSSGAPHTGYYWLAYDWRNLLPACFQCNNAKSDQFPVGKDHSYDPAPESDELDAKEGPLLICPYLEQPEDYLEFDEFGIVLPKNGNPRGQATIDVFDLNRSDLVDDRWQRQLDSQTALAAAVSNAVLEGKAVSDYMGSWIGEAAPFSQAVRDYAKLRLGRANLTLSGKTSGAPP